VLNEPVLADEQDDVQADGEDGDHYLPLLSLPK
jgi:hypothetical protein